MTKGADGGRTLPTHDASGCMAGHIMNSMPSCELNPEDVERFGRDPLGLFKANLANVEERIALACRRAGRPPASVRLLPISKTVPAHVLRFAYQAGVRSFGENRVQEALCKHRALAGLPIEWSIVGHLQTNKVKHLTRFAHEFHALDSLRLADLLNERLAREDGFLDVYVQVNTSGEESKFGLHPDALLSFVNALEQFPRLRPRGLMTLALFSPDMGKVRPCFRLLRRLRDEAVKRNPALTKLSMGMSGDFEAAIEEGADVVRVGQAIFGKRPTPDGHYWPGLAPA
jgi:PLP dependent protein